jgi:hypothetical protein
VVESQPSKLLVAGSIPVSRSRVCNAAMMREWDMGETRSERRNARAEREGEAERSP